MFKAVSNEREQRWMGMMAARVDLILWSVLDCGKMSRLKLQRMSCNKLQHTISKLFAFHLPISMAFYVAKR